jgi:hypothetical protein
MKKVDENFVSAVINSFFVDYIKQVNNPPIHYNEIWDVANYCASFIFEDFEKKNKEELTIQDFRDSIENIVSKIMEDFNKKNDIKITLEEIDDSLVDVFYVNYLKKFFKINDKMKETKEDIIEEISLFTQDFYDFIFIIIWVLTSNWEEADEEDLEDDCANCDEEDCEFHSKNDFEDFCYETCKDCDEDPKVTKKGKFLN